MKILVTGSSGLIGSEVCSYFGKQGHVIHGIDNNQRAVFFGPQGDTSWRLKELRDAIPSFNHHDLDIRDRYKLLDLVKTIQPDAIVHAAAQPSHDKAASIPFDDFDVNAVGTINLLESARKWCTESPFVHMSTNKESRQACRVASNRLSVPTALTSKSSKGMEAALSWDGWAAVCTTASGRIVLTRSKSL